MVGKRKRLAQTIKSPPAPPWQASQTTYLAARAHLDGCDELARQMEAKWGVGRLRLLVSNELRERFDRQRVMLGEAMAQGDVADVQREAGRMVNAWRALDGAAEGAGASQAAPEVWEVRLSDGRVLGLRRGNGRIERDGRYLDVVSIEEVAKLYECFPELVKVKETFPGARVEAVRRASDPIEDWDARGGDDLVGI